MNHDLEETHDETTDQLVYVGLLCLTALTLGASLFARGGRIMAVSLALIIASVKATLVAFYYMGLRGERSMTFVILAVGFLAVLALLIGIIPDMTFARL